MKTIKCDISTVSLIEDDVLLIDIDEDQQFELKDFLQLKDAAFNFGKGKRYFNIIDVGIFTVPDSETRQESASEKGCEFKKADAFVIYSLPQRIVGNFYLKINKPKVPTKFFNTIEAAKLWINELKQSSRITVPG